MSRDYNFVSNYCVVIIQDCDNEEMAIEKLAEIVKDPKIFRLDTLEGEEEEEEEEEEDECYH